MMLWAIAVLATVISFDSVRWFESHAEEAWILAMSTSGETLVLVDAIRCSIHCIFTASSPGGRKPRCHQR
eukprot:5893542-Amphidinium_carterae.1